IDAVAGVAADAYYAVDAALQGDLKGVIVGVAAMVTPGVGARTVARDRVIALEAHVRVRGMDVEHGVAGEDVVARADLDVGVVSDQALARVRAAAKCLVLGHER